MEPCCSRFTPAEGGTRLAATASVKNLLAVEYEQFISTRLIHEEAYKIRGVLSSGSLRSIFVCRASRVPCTAFDLRTLTDLSVAQSVGDDDCDWREELEEKEVLVCTSGVLKHILEDETLTMSQINVLILDSAHLIFTDDNLKFIMKLYKQCEVDKNPRILALTYPPFSSIKKDYDTPDQETIDTEDNFIDIESDIDNDTKKDSEDIPKIESKSVDNMDSNEPIDNDNEIIEKIESENQLKDNIETIEKKSIQKEIGVYENLDDFKMYEMLSWKIDQLEEELCCEMDLAEDIDGGKRLALTISKPRELIIEYSDRTPDVSEEYIVLDQFMRDTVNGALAFLTEHRYDPTEIYGKDMFEELQDQPDPTLDPKELFKQFIYVLDQLGPFGADKAAFTLLCKLEKLKIRIPYERHFLLLCLCTTAFVKIRAYADDIFSKHESDWEKIKRFSTPKVHRLAEILEKFQPDQSKTGSSNTPMNAIHMLKDLDKCDFIGLSNKIEDKVNTYEANLKEIYDDSSNTKVHKSGDNEQEINNLDEITENSNIRKEEGSPEKEEINTQDILEMQNNTEIESNCWKVTEICNETPIFVEIEDKKKGNSLNNDQISTEIVNSDSKTDEIIIIQNSNGEDISLVTQDILCKNDKINDSVPEENSSDNKDSIVQSDENLSNANETIDKTEEFSREGSTKNHNIDNTEEISKQIDSKYNQNVPMVEEQNIDQETEEILKISPEDSQNVLKAEGSSKSQNINAEEFSKEIDSKRNQNIDQNIQKSNEISNEIGLKDSQNGSKVEENPKNQDFIEQRSVLGVPRRIGRVRGRTRVPRQNAARILQLQQNPDALCGIVFMKEPLMAKILFTIIVDMSRSHPGLSHLCALYCAVCPPPGVELQESQRQRKKQEDVLKKFRMHECNLLLATSVLEEGIDLPRCNLVVRWDLPPSYRSYGLCRSRARASRSCCALMCHAEPRTDMLLHNLATYRELDQLISRKCGCAIQDEPPQFEEDHADNFTTLIKAYTPTGKINNQNINRNSVSREKVGDNSASCEKVGDNSASCEKDKMTVNSGKTGDKVQNSDETDSNCNCAKKDNRISNSETISDLCENLNVISNKSKSDFRTNINKIQTPNNFNNNIICNKCNCERDSVNTECPCNVMSNINVINNNNNRGDNKGNEIASVDLSTAIALINRYCAKLPSDTFTRLAPQWWMEQVQLPVRGELRKAYICTVRLPLNCPVKYNIVGHPMPTRVLARRMVALQACRILHKSGELDDQLMPIGKENFKTTELDTASGNNASSDKDDGDARPGTTKRRQYYFKRTAWAFTDCQPIIDTSDTEIIDPKITSDEHKTEEKPFKEEEKQNNERTTKRNMLYAIVSELCCALPERYNTRGRRLHAPQHASQAIGILMARNQPDSLQIPAFPVYTRSGEVRVRVEFVPDADVRMSPRRGTLVRRFMRFVFSEVLRVRRKGMKLQSDATTHNNYYIVPTVKRINLDGSTKIDIDWSFLELIYEHTEAHKKCEIEKPILWQEDEEEKVESAEKIDGAAKKMDNPLLKPGEVFMFDAEKYKEAVVTPWYRNQDQPQFFLVAEICWNLTPDSAFPSATHNSFRSYYQGKYGVTLTQPNQPLLDVDHTSARLNLLTPRYVNRKGVALPVSSERTRRAKRDRLDQKQILVPELCRVHPFAAPLWFATVALPCVLYRINALLIADEIRRAVAIDVGLGVAKIDERHQWPPLDFGWSLSDVLNNDAEKNEKKKHDASSDLDEQNNAIEDTEESELDKKQSEGEEKEVEETKEKTLNDILQEKEAAVGGFEIGTWSNEMASSIPQTTEYDELMEPLPPNLTFCTSASGGTNWCDPIERPRNQFNPTRSYYKTDSDGSYISSDFTDTDDSDLNSVGSDEDNDTSGFGSISTCHAGMGVRIEYKTLHEAEAVDVELASRVNAAPPPDAADDARDRRECAARLRDGRAPGPYIEKFHSSVATHRKEIIENGLLIKKDQPIAGVLPEQTREVAKPKTDAEIEQIADRLSKIDERSRELFDEIFPYGNTDLLESGQINLESIEKNKRVLLAELKKSLPEDEIKKLNCFSMVDIDIDSSNFRNEKVEHVGFDTIDSYVEKVNTWQEQYEFKPYYEEIKGDNKEFDFDYQPDLEGHPGPSPSLILQALTMSNANDGINLERLETIGDSFLKFAITAYLYCAHPTVHEGKLSHMRSKQVSNLNLYRLGRSKRLGARMIASKFEPHDNWLPPCHKPPPTLHTKLLESQESPVLDAETPQSSSGCFIPYNLITQHSIPDKSIADCVEALIGAYLLACGPRGALLFMSWLGIRVLPRHDAPLHSRHPWNLMSEETVRQKSSLPPSPKRSSHNISDSEESSSEWDECQQREESAPEEDWSWCGRAAGSLRPYRDTSGRWMQPIFGALKAPPSPLLRYIADPDGELERMLSGYDALERTLQYRFKDRSLLLQALTHASHHNNRLTDCYQRLEFLGDAILDYLITRHLYEDPRRHSPGALTDLRSALVNNTIFATLAARHGFHKYFRHMSPGLNEVLTKYVKIQEENGHSISEEHYLIQEDEMEQAEDVEVPKALGDLFESVAGAIFIDSGMSLGAVWKSYVNLMGAELEAFSAAAPKSPVRELLEAEPDTAKFGKPERLADGRRVRVCVEVFGRGTFKGIGRNYRIAKGTAARCALRHLRIHRAR